MALLAGSGGGGGVEVDHETTPVEVDNVVTGDSDFLIGVHVGLQVKSEGGITDDTGGTAQVMDPDEIIGVSGLLAGALEVGLSDDFNFHDVSPLPFWFCSLPGQSGRLWGFPGRSGFRMKV